MPSTASPNLLCVPATIDLAGAEIELVSMVARERRLKQALTAEALDELDVDYVFIDCPPSLGLLTVNALVAAEEVLIPIQCEYYALEGLGQLLRNIDLVQAHLNPTLHVSTILLTMYDGRTKLADQVTSEVRSHFGDTVLQTVIPRSVKVSEAPGYGQTVLAYDPGSRGATSYLDAAREIAERGGGRTAGRAVDAVSRAQGRAWARARRADPDAARRPRRDPGDGRRRLASTGARARPRRSAARPPRRRSSARRRWHRSRARCYREIAGRRDPAEPAAAAHGVRRGGAGRAGALDPRVRPAAADRRARAGGRRLRAGHGRAAAGGRRSGPGCSGSRRSSGSTADDAMLRDALLENIHRVQLNPLEEAAAYQQLLEEFGVTHEELADRLGRSRPVVTNTIRLLKLPVAGAAAGRGRRAVRRARPGAARAGRRRAAGGAGRPDRRRGPVGAGDRGGRGAGPPARRRPRRAAPVQRGRCRRPGLQDLAERLSDTFDTRVKVELGQRKGRIVVEFGSVDDLERIAELMSPDGAESVARVVERRD